MSTGARSMPLRANRGARTALAIVALVAVASRSSAQVSVGDSLWQRGKITEATAAYSRVLAADRYSVRANILVARAMAWNSNIDSALVLLRNARVRVPDDIDVRFSEALYLSWDKRFDQAIARFDSLITMHPDLDYVRVARARTRAWKGDLAGAETEFRQMLTLPLRDKDAKRDAEIGLAQVTSWRGNLASASAQYEALQADDPTDTRVMLGLASVRSWQGRPLAAADLLSRVVVRDSSNLEARELLSLARMASRPRTDIEFDWSDDSDGDQNFWSVISQRLHATDRLRIGAQLGSLRATDPARNATRHLAVITLTTAGTYASFDVALGARLLDPGGAASSQRSVLTARAGVSLRPANAMNLSFSAARLPFDEIASLLGRALDLTALDATAELGGRRGPLLSLTGGTLAFSDGNHRETATLRLAQRWQGLPWFGVYARMMRFAEKRPGYFSPTQFSLYEAQSGWERESGFWTGSIGGGLGVQKVDPSKPWQSAYHAELRVQRSWPNGNSIALSSGLSTSAASSAVGAFKYRTAALSAGLAW